MNNFALQGSEYGDNKNELKKKIAHIKKNQNIIRKEQNS